MGWCRTSAYHSFMGTSLKRAYTPIMSEALAWLSVELDCNSHILLFDLSTSDAAAQYSVMALIVCSLCSLGGKHSNRTVLQCLIDWIWDIWRLQHRHTHFHNEVWMLRWYETGNFIAGDSGLGLIRISNLVSITQSCLIVSWRCEVLAVDVLILVLSV